MIKLDIRSSDIAMFDRCPRKFTLRKFYGLDKVLRPSDKVSAANIGTAIHSLMENYYRPTGSLLDPLDVLSPWIDEHRDQEGYSAALNTVLLMWQRYAGWLALTSPDKGFEVMEVEKTFRTVMFQDAEYEVAVTGTADVIRKDDFGFIDVLDHKTVTTVGQNDSTLLMNNQGLTYCVLASDHYETLVQSFTHNQIRRTDAKKPTAALFGRSAVTYEAKKLENHARYLNKKVEQIVTLHRELREKGILADGAYPVQDASCSDNRFKCAFVEHCSSIGVHYTQERLVESGEFKKAEL